MQKHAETGSPKAVHPFFRTRPPKACRLVVARGSELSRPSESGASPALSGQLKPEQGPGKTAATMAEPNLHEELRKELRHVSTKHSTEIWASLTSDQHILQAISGYKIEFFAYPEQKRRPREFKSNAVETEVKRKIIIDLRKRTSWRTSWRLS